MTLPQKKTGKKCRQSVFSSIKIYSRCDVNYIKVLKCRHTNIKIYSRCDVKNVFKFSLYTVIGRKSFLFCVSAYTHTRTLSTERARVSTWYFLFTREDFIPFPRRREDFIVCSYFIFKLQLQRICI